MLGIDLQLPLPRMTYDEAMERFGHDAPDLRFGLELVDCSDLAPQSEFGVFKSVIADGGKRARRSTPRAAASSTRAAASTSSPSSSRGVGAKGLAWFKVEADGKLDSPIAKFFAEELLAKFAERMQGRAGRPAPVRRRQVGGDLQGAARAAHEARQGAEAVRPAGDALLVGRRVPDVRLRRRGEALGRDAPSVHRAAGRGPRPARQPTRRRCGPRPTTWSSTATKPAAARSVSTTPACSRKVFTLLGIDARDGQQERFGFLLDALQYGAPPHGGIALGIDRWVMLFGRLDNIRDCIAFPKTQKATDLMTDAPGTVDARQLRELAIKLAGT